MTETPNAIDLLVGGSIRFWRLMRDMTLSEVADALGVSTAAVGSMEAGYTRVDAEALFQLCRLLQIAPAAIYDDRDSYSSH